MESGRSMFARAFAFQAVVLAVVLCAAPGSAFAKAAPVAKAQITVAADVNPDSSGRASPIVVRVYQLKEEGQFASSDFFAIYDNESATLGGGFIAREEYVLQPGESREIELKLEKEAKFLGVLAAYRDIRNAKWRAVSAAPEKNLIDLIRKDRVTLTVSRAEVAIQIGKPKPDKPEKKKKK
jgi:type VI secretion system protein VasD